MWSLGIWLLLATVTLAGLVVAHVALLWAVVSNTRIVGRDRLLALVPPLLPWVAYRGGYKLGAGLWCGLLAAYALLRTLG